MTPRTSRIRSFVAIALFAAALAAPTIARALPSEALSWTRTYAGPNDIPVFEHDSIPVGGAFNAVSFADASNGWAVGIRVDNASQIPGAQSGFFAYTGDGGSTWTSGTVGVIFELNAVDAITSSDVWAVGNNGTIVHWNGFSWSTRTVAGWPAGKALRGVSFADSLHGWAVGDGRGVVYTGDGGDTWSIIAVPGTGVLNAVAAKSSTSALAVGDQGQIKALSATSVTSRATIGNTLYGVTFADEMHVWVVGSDAGIFKSSDGGATFTTATRALPGGDLTPSKLIMRSVAFANPYDGMIVATYQMVWRTSDAGASWTYERLSDPSTLDDYELRGVAFAGSAAVPVTVGRAYGGFLPHSGSEKARAYRGSWVGIPPQAPFAPTGVSVAEAGAPRPRAEVSWTDNSSDEDGFVVEKSAVSASGPWTPLTTTGANATSYVDGAVTWSSTYYYRVQSFRGDLYSGWATSGPFAADVIAPTTTSDARGAYVESATVTFTASDNLGGSGVVHTYSTIDGATQLDGTERLITGFGSHTLAFWSVDLAGNTETQHSVALHVSDPSIVDTTPPVTTSDRHPEYAVSATIVLTASDSGSGVAHTYYRLDGGSQVESLVVTVGSTGTHTLQFWSVDLAGMGEAVHTVTFTVVTPPSSSGVPSTPSTPASVRHGSSFTTYGYVSRHSTTTKTITLQFYRSEHGHWVLRKTVTAKVTNFLTFSKYSKSTSVPYAGSWRVRARNSDSGHSHYSGYRTFRAR